MLRRLEASITKMPVLDTTATNKNSIMPIWVVLNILCIIGTNIAAIAIMNDDATAPKSHFGSSNRGHSNKLGVFNDLMQGGSSVKLYHPKW